MLFLHRQDTGPAATWWATIERYPSAAPGLIRALMSDRSVLCESAEARQAVAWARAHPAWNESAPSLVASELGGVPG